MTYVSCSGVVCCNNMAPDLDSGLFTATDWVTVLVLGAVAIPQTEPSMVTRGAQDATVGSHCSSGTFYKEHNK